jgi:hypothetical protein
MLVTAAAMTQAGDRDQVMATMVKAQSASAVLLHLHDE